MKQVQEAYIVAATRTPIGRSHRGFFRNMRPDDLLVSEEYLMTLERKAFCALLEHPKTQERIMGMMSTGKPVRN